MFKLRALTFVASVILLTLFVLPFLAAAETNPTYTTERLERAARSIEEQVAESPSTFLDNLYIWMLGFVGLAALFAIVYGGILYIFSGAIESTAEARRWITNAFWGLLIAALSFLILYTINPELVRKFDIESIIRRREPAQTAPAPATQPQTPSPYIYQWAEVPFNQYCADVLGIGWVDGSLNECEAGVGAAPTSTADCCKKTR